MRVVSLFQRHPSSRSADWTLSQFINHSLFETALHAVSIRSSTPSCKLAEDPSPQPSTSSAALALLAHLERQEGVTEPLHVSMPFVLKSCASTSPPHPRFLSNWPKSETPSDFESFADFRQPAGCHPNPMAHHISPQSLICILMRHSLYIFYGLSAIVLLRTSGTPVGPCLEELLNSCRPELLRVERTI